MKTPIKIAASFIALIAVLSLLGWVEAIDNLKAWCDRYVATSLRSEPTRTANKVITAPKVISIIVKNDIPNYAQMTIRELKALCTGTSIKGWSRLSKAALIEALIAQN